MTQKFLKLPYKNKYTYTVSISMTHTHTKPDKAEEDDYLKKDKAIGRGMF